MKVIKTDFEGLVILEPNAFEDKRGFFLETYNKKDFEKNGIFYTFVQDNHSKSAKNVLRGLHFQINNPQGKLVRCIAGSILDVAVDIREGSHTFGNHFMIELNAINKLSLMIPPGFAHGFLTLEENTEINYKCTDFYNPNDEGGIIWNDKELNIDWPTKNPILSEKDSSFGTISDLKQSL